MNGCKNLLVMAVMLALTGCLVTPQQQRMELDLAEMKRRLADNERGLVGLRQAQNGNSLQQRLETLVRSQADLDAGLDALRVELQTLRGRLEDLARQDAGASDELSLMRDDLGLKIAAFDERLARLEAQAKAAPQAAATLPPQTPEALYQKGLALIQKDGDYSGGRETLQTYLRQNPQSELAVNAMYWIGEAYYGEKKYENAILQFQDVIQNYAKHPKAAAALLKQGLAFYALKDLQNARVILQKVIDAYPASEEAKKAKARLAEWSS